MSIPRFNIEFSKTNSPIEGYVTKFGGQPNWLEEPEWPHSRSTNHPMRFICQISLAELSLEEPYDNGMIYLFMMDSEFAVGGKLFGAYDQFEPEGGENAVIFQPGGVNSLVETRPLVKGPSLLPKEAMYWQGDEVEAWGKVEEYEVVLNPAIDPEFVSIHELVELPESQHDQYCDSLSGNKLAGVPGFIQPDEFPFLEKRSQLVLQLDSGRVPFYVDFGDIGVGYLFVEKGGNTGRFLWQCG